MEAAKMPALSSKCTDDTLCRLVSLPKPTGPPVAQFLAAGTFVVDPLPNSKHFLIPVVAGAHRDAESVARLPNRLAIDEHQLIKRRLLRLRMDAMRFAVATFWALGCEGEVVDCLVWISDSSFRA